MIRKLTALLHKEFHMIHKAALLISVFTFVSQILGLVRDRLLAGMLGADIELDIYYMAFRVPDLLFVGLASLVAFTILIPFFVEKERESHKHAKHFLSSIFTIFSGIMVLVAIVLGIAMPWVAPVVAPGFDVAASNKLIMLSRIILLSPLLMGASNLVATVTQSYKRFFVFALSPVLYNLGIISGVVFFYPIFGLQGLAYGVVLGALLHFSIQLPVLWRLSYIPRITLAIDWREIKRVLATSFPRTFTLALSNITLLVLGALATTVAAGAVSVFDLAKHVHSVPIALIGMSFSVAAFPTLVRLYADNEVTSFINHIMVPAKQILFWSFPIMALFIVLRAQIVRVLFGTGEFDWTDTRLTAAALALFMLSVVAHSLNLLLVRAYYAAGKTYRPLLMYSIGTVVTISLSYILLSWYQSSTLIKNFIGQLLRVPDVSGGGVLMLPLAYSIGMGLICFLLWMFFRRDFQVSLRERLGRTVRDSLGAAVLMGFASYGALQVFASFLPLHVFWGILLQGVLAGIVGIVVGILFLLYVKNQEFISLLRATKQKFWKMENILISSSKDDVNYE